MKLTSICWILLGGLTFGCSAGSASIEKAEVSEDGLRLRLGTGTCNATHQFWIEESADAVTIKAVIAEDGQKGNDCMDMVTVDLPTAARRSF